MPSAAIAPQARTDAGSLSTARVVAARAFTVPGLVLALISLLAVYVHYELLDDGTFRGTESRLLQSGPIRTQVASSAVDALYANVDVAAAIESELPPAQKGLAGPVAAAFRTVAERAAGQLLGRPDVQARLVDSLDVSHRQLVRLLHDRGRFTRVEGGVVYVDMAQLVDGVAARLGLPPAVVQRVPASAARIEILRADQLRTTQRAVRALDFLASWLWLFALACGVVAVALVPGRRRKELRAIAAGLVIVGLLVLLVRRMAGTYVVEHLVPTASTRPAAAAAYDIVTRDLKGAALTDIFAGVVALVGVWLAGPRPRAQVVLRWLAPSLRRPLAVYGSYVLLWLLLLLWKPTVQFGRTRYVLLMLVSGAVGLEALRRLARRRHPNVAPVSVAASVQAWLASFRTPGDGGPATEAAQLEALAALHDAGKLTDDEFATAKTRVLV